MFKSIIVIPCYNVKNKILHVTQKIDLDKVYKVIIVDDFCPQKTGNFVKKKLIKNLRLFFLKKI